MPVRSFHRCEILMLVTPSFPPNLLGCQTMARTACYLPRAWGSYLRIKATVCTVATALGILPHSGLSPIGISMVGLDTGLWRRLQANGALVVDQIVSGQ